MSVNLAQSAVSGTDRTTSYMPNMQHIRMVEPAVHRYNVTLTTGAIVLVDTL